MAASDIPATSFAFGQGSYPTPRSSTDKEYRPTSFGVHVNPHRTALNSVRSEVIPKSKGFSGLHTPQASVDKPNVEDKVTRLLQKIKDLNENHTGYSSEKIDDVLLDEWRVLSEKYSEKEDRDCNRKIRLEYLGKEKILFITYPTRVHESFHAFLATTIKILHNAEEDGFRVETNSNVSRDTDAVLSKLTPDLGVALSEKSKDGRQNLLHLIVFECAYSQTNSDLDRKISVYFDDRKDLLAVVCLRIQPSHAFRNPDEAPSPDQQPIDLKDFQVEPRKILEAVRYDNHTWSPAIKELKIEFHHEDKRPKQTFNLTPGYLGGPADAEREWGKAETALCTLLRRAMTPLVFDRLVPEATFEIPRETFFSRLDEALIIDGHERYHEWVRKKSTVKVSAVKRPAPAPEGEDGEDASRFVKRLRK